MAHGATSRQKRRERRSTLTAGASGRTNLPLSDRDTPWDSAAAKKSLSEAQYPAAHFWKDPEGDPKTLAAYKLPFATAQSGTLTAVWKGVTAAAGALSGARGGVQIPDADVPAVQAKIASYYRKAAKQFEDPGIKAPWLAAKDESAIHLLAYAETGDDSGAEYDERIAHWSVTLAPAQEEADRETAVRLALVSAGVEELARAPLASVYDLTRGSLAERLFYAAALDAGYTEMGAESWPCEGTLDGGKDVLFRDGDDEIVYRREDGTLAFTRLRNGWFHTVVAAESRDTVAGALSTFRAAYPALFRITDEDATVVPITFWAYSKNFGPMSRLRVIESATWDAIEHNYSGEARSQLAKLMNGFEPGKNGQLILWQGEPGTGKSWALRALASEWRDWAEFSYITDPDAFFVGNPDYLIDVLLHDSYEEILMPASAGEDAQVVTSAPEGKWRVLILEDTGELLAANAKEAYGQGLSRLLNVVDGMIGQGLRILVLVTTNDELDVLHPAVARPGRCAAQIEFSPFTAEEASEWLGAEVEEAATLAELYALRGEAEPAFDADTEELQEDRTQCADCGHMRMAHTDGTGACSMQNCDCSAFAEDSVVAAGAMVWAPEDGVKDLLDDIDEQLAVYEGGYCAKDVSVAFDKALIECEAEEQHYVAPISVSSTGDVTVAPMADWVEVDKAWVTEEPDAGTSGPTLGEAIAAASANLPGAPAGWRKTFAAEAPALPAEHQPGDTAPAPQPSPTPEPVEAGSAKRWKAVLAPEGVPTDDGRMFAEGSITWRDLPLSLAAMLETADGHDGARVCGKIDRIWREGNLVMGEGVFDESDFGNEIARMVADGVLRGLSVDIAIRSYEAIYDEEADSVTYLVLDGVIGMATVCAFPAFAEANIALVASTAPYETWSYTHQAGMVVTASAAADVDDPELAEVVALASAPLDVPGAGNDDEGLTAAAPPLAPPANWFDPPNLDELTPLTVTPEGHVYGHLASFDRCHIGIEVCTTAPHSQMGYAYFHLGQIECEDGEMVAIGKITLGTGHADPRLGFRAAIDHYDDTGTVVADVRAGEDEHGIWVAGALRPNVDADRVRELRAAQLSGDWRRIDDHLEMIAALAVNVPGFPVPQPRALVASGEVFTLIAVGVHDGETPENALVIDQATLEKIAALSASAAGVLDEGDEQ